MRRAGRMNSRGTNIVLRLPKRQNFRIVLPLCLLIILSPLSVCAGTETAFRDILLVENGSSKLVVTDSTGTPLSGCLVSLYYRSHRIATARTDARGTVRVVGMRPGLHVVQIGAQQIVCRFWDKGSAPPTAVSRPAFVMSEELARGQYYGPMMGYPMQPMMGPPMVAPVLLATGVTAVAVAAVLVGKSEGDDPMLIPATP